MNAIRSTAHTPMSYLCPNIFSLDRLGGGHPIVEGNTEKEENLTHCGLVMPYGNIELVCRCLMAPSHYLSQRRLINTCSKNSWYSSEGIMNRESKDTNQ